MAKEKYQPPQNMEALENMVYWGSAEESNRYDKYHRNPGGSPDGLNLSERDMKTFLSKLGPVEKIPEATTTTPDFIVGANLFVEVKSVNTLVQNEVYPFEKPINLKGGLEWLEKVNLTLDDVRKKSVPRGGKLVAVVWIDLVQHVFFDSTFFEKIVEHKAINLNGISALLVYFQLAGGNVQNKIPILLSKDSDLISQFKTAYGCESLQIISG